MQFVAMDHQLLTKAAWHVFNLTQKRLKHFFICQHNILVSTYAFASMHVLPMVINGKTLI